MNSGNWTLKWWRNDPGFDKKLKSVKSQSGREGEKEAARYLEKKGYEIVKRNFRTSGVEIDLIAITDDILCFIEVKTRKSSHFGFPEEFVDHRKMERIIRGASVFGNKKEYRHLKIRFDVISVLYRGKTFQINHLENAFEG
jgi:putative endonuclease